MAIEQRVVTVAGNDYLITHLPTTKGLVVMKSLVKLLGPVLGSLTETSGPSVLVEALAENIDNVDVVELIQRLMVTVTKANGQPLNFETDFAGQYHVLIALAKEVVDFNYGSVFTLLGSAE